MPFFLKLQKLPAKVRIKNEPTKQSARFSSSPITLSSNGDLPKDFQLYPKERQKDIVRDEMKELGSGPVRCHELLAFHTH
jgi:hypothetical protein